MVHSSCENCVKIILQWRYNARVNWSLILIVFQMAFGLEIDSNGNV